MIAAYQRSRHTSRILLSEPISVFSMSQFLNMLVVFVALEA